MSYTKEIFEGFIINPVNSIKETTINQNDCSEILECINNMFTVRDELIQKDIECGSLWNEICIDVISLVNSAFSGFYRTATIGLRSVFEMGCNSIFYYDHKVEYHMFKKENMKADKYVSVLVNEYSFFKSKYIRAFKDEIDDIQKEEDSISKYLIRLYGELSDIVHGRYSKLTNIEDFSIEYNVKRYKQFEKLFIETVDILLILAMLRVNVTVNNEEKIYRNTGVIKYE